MSNNQKNVFLETEANDWFARNRKIIDEYKGNEDAVVNMVNRYSLGNSNVLEIGASAGHKLNYLKQHYQCNVCGVEPSLQAIDYGKVKYGFSNEELVQATADEMGFFKENQFDVVIVGFVFYVIDRGLLLKVAAEINRILKNGGSLIIVDFFSAIPQRNVYHHLPNQNMYSYKQDYGDLFIASRTFFPIAKDTLNHELKSYCANDDFYNKYCVSLLKKSVDGAY